LARIRVQRSIQKQLRSNPRLRHMRAEVDRLIRLHRSAPLHGLLLQVVLDPPRGQLTRSDAANVLNRAFRRDVSTQPLLDLFLRRQQEHDELYETALTLEMCAGVIAIRPLIRAMLGDPNPHRRKAAARALGWMHRWRRPSIARALAQCLTDPAQPQPAREEAAESLAYAGYASSVPALAATLRDPDPRLRFWAAFALGSRCEDSNAAVIALESVLQDKEVCEGWWSVRHEALAMLGNHGIPPHREQLEAELNRVRSDSEASKEDRRWLDTYSDKPVV
jgi:hypothetical protein